MSVIVSREAAKRFFGNDDPIGRTLPMGQEQMTIVGVVEDVKYSGVANHAEPVMYRPFSQSPFRIVVLFARTTGDPAAIANELRQVIQTYDRDINIGSIQPLTTWLTNAVAQPRFRALLLATIAVIALLLAMVGLYGVIAYTTSQRTQEIGLRVAIGAQRADVVRLVLGEGTRLALAGIALGLVGCVLGGTAAVVVPLRRDRHRPARICCSRDRALRRCARRHVFAGEKSSTRRSDDRAEGRVKDPLPRYSEEVKARSLSALLFAAFLSACGSQPKEEDYPAKIAAIRAAKDESFKTDPDSPVPADKKTALLPLAYFPIDEGYAVPASLEPARRAHPHAGADVDRQDPRHRAHRHAEVLDQGQAASPHRVPRPRITAGKSAVRAVLGSHKRRRNLSGRTLHGAGSDADRHLRRRLQRRLSPVLLLQPRVRLSLPAQGKPSRSADSRRREDAESGFKHSVTALQAIVFDFDGVIADSERLHLRSYQEILAPEGITMTERGVFQPLPRL